MAAFAPAKPNRQILEAALEGLEAQKQKVDSQITQVRSMMGGRVAKRTRTNHASPGATAKRAPLSAAARLKIAKAQKRRWAAFRKAQAQAK